MLGSSLAILAALAGSAKDTISKKVSFSVDGTISAFASFAFAIPCYLVLLAFSVWIGWEQPHVGTSFFLFVLLRSFSDTFAESFKMHALSKGEFSSVAALIALHPVISLFTSPILTGDPITRPMIIGVVLAVVGNLIIMTSGKERPSGRAITYSLLTAFFFSINTCFDRLSVGAGSPIISGIAMNILAGLFLLPTLYFKRNAILELKTHASAFWVRGCIEALFMSLKLNALRFITGPELSALMRSNLIFTIISGNRLFGEVGFWRKLLGALITVLGIVIMILG
jgi:uncharacterized membrane protein